MRRRSLYFRSFFNRWLKFKSLLLNDRWVIESVYNGMKNGFFVEAGAYDGVFNSSCHVLEKRYGWSGICIEPHGELYESCVRNRPCSIVERAALSDRAGKATFVEAATAGYSGIKTNLLKIEQIARNEGWVKDQWRTSGPRVERQVETLTLHELLQKHGAPQTIDYIAMDIEGSEAPAFTDFPFQDYRIGCLSIEGPDCDGLLEAQGFVRVDNPFNRVGPWEHYFVRRDLAETLPLKVVA